MYKYSGGVTIIWKWEKQLLLHAAFILEAIEKNLEPFQFMLNDKTFVWSFTLK